MTQTQRKAQRNQRLYLAYRELTDSRLRDRADRIDFEEKIAAVCETLRQQTSAGAVDMQVVAEAEAMQAEHEQRWPGVWGNEFA
jgi:hypothetical protein